MSRGLSRIHCRSAATAFGIACVLFGGSLAAAVQPQAFLGLVSHTGVGKHPKQTRVGVFIDESHVGSQFFCFSYSITTKKKIRGRIDVDIDVIDADGVRRIVTLEKVAIRKLDLASSNPSDNPCEPPALDNLDINFGVVAECRFISENLRKGEIVRWTTNFKKAARLKGPLAVVNSIGQVVSSPASGDITLYEAERLVRNQALPSLAEGFE